MPHSRVRSLVAAFWLIWCWNRAFALQTTGCGGFTAASEVVIYLVAVIEAAGVRELSVSDMADDTHQQIGRVEGERVVAFAKALKDENICGPDALASIVAVYVAATFKAKD